VAENRISECELGPRSPPYWIRSAFTRSGSYVLCSIFDDGSKLIVGTFVLVLERFNSGRYIKAECLLRLEAGDDNGAYTGKPCLTNAMSQPPLRHGQSSSSDYANEYRTNGPSHHYDQRNDYNEYIGGNGDTEASRERRGGGYGGFDDMTQLADSDLRQSHSGASANGGRHEEGQHEDQQRSAQSRNRNRGTRIAADGEGTRQIEG